MRQKASSLCEARLWPALCAIIIISCATLLGACSSPAPPAPLEFSEKRKKRIATLFEHVELIQSDPTSQNAVGYWDQMVAASGREDLVAQIKTENYDSYSSTCTPLNDADPLDQIVDMSSDYSIIIINEDHAMPYHRGYIQELARRLRAEGFTHYAAEMLTPEGTQNSGYRTIDDGWYTTDPLMSRLMHEVRQLGYAQIAYEQRPDQSAPEGSDMNAQIAARESAQAANLREAVFDQAPDTKILIHVGHGHVAEEPAGTSEWMAARLKKTTGIDPLTISLTDCTSGTDKAVLSQETIHRSGKSMRTYTDYLVGLPPISFEEGRPTYRQWIGDRAVPVPPSLLPSDEPVMIEARTISTVLEREPIERLYLAPGENLPLMLPTGSWSLVSFTQSGEILATETVDVND